MSNKDNGIHGIITVLFMRNGKRKIEEKIVSPPKFKYGLMMILEFHQATLRKHSHILNKF